MSKSSKSILKPTCLPDLCEAPMKQTIEKLNIVKRF